MICCWLIVPVLWLPVRLPEPPAAAPAVHTWSA